MSLEFSKFLTIRSDQISHEILSREERELLFAMEVDGDSPESCFIEDALKQLAERLSITPPPITPLIEKPAKSVVEPPKKIYSCAFSEKEVDADVAVESPVVKNVPEGSEKGSSISGKIGDYNVFY